MTQLVRLTGNGTEGFADCVRSVMTIDDVFGRQLDAGTFIPWSCEKYMDWDAFPATNRYFTDARKRSYLNGVPFALSEDPDGMLTNLTRGGELVHCDDNKVDYFKRIGNHK
jgi:hypothetical protein